MVIVTDGSTKDNVDEAATSQRPLQIGSLALNLGPVANTKVADENVVPYAAKVNTLREQVGSRLAATISSI